MEVALDLPALLPEQQREQHPAAHPPGQPRPEARRPRRPRDLDLVPMLGEEPPPGRDVPVLDLRQLPVDPGAFRVPLGPGQLPVEEGGVGFVLEVVEPGWGGRGTGAWCKEKRER